MDKLLRQRFSFIQHILDEYVPEVPPPLDHKDPFTLLVAVLLSAQCTDERVNQVTPRLFDLAPGPAEMVQLGADRIEEIIRPCGISKVKSKSIWMLSSQLMQAFGGDVPDTMEELESLPGVGHKTASVVMVQAYGVPAFPVDTHIFRLARRWGLSEGGNVGVVESDLKQLVPVSQWGRFHLQMIYFGRKYCKAKGHDEESCPVCRMLKIKS